MTWNEWQNGFNSLYGAGDWVDDSVATWIAEIFLPGGITPDEAYQAALAVARAGALARPHQILSAIVEAVRGRRGRELAARETQERQSREEGGGTCKYCDGSGWASVPAVPQPDFAIRKGFIQTCCVTCRCIAGLRMSSVKNHKGESAMTLEQYETRYGSEWYSEQQARRRLDGALARVRLSTSAWDESIRKVMANLRRKDSA